MSASKDKRKRYAISFGKALQQARQNANLTQEDLAFKTELHRTTIGLFERGIKCPSLDTFYRLAIALGINPIELFELVDEQLKEENE